MNRRVSTSFPSKRKLLIITVPTGNTHLPVSAGPALHDARSGLPAVLQSLTWIFPPGGSTNARALLAPSDHSGPFTSKMTAEAAKPFTFVADMQSGTPSLA